MGAPGRATGKIVDFAFGYGNPAILRAFRLPAATRDRYTLLEALPRMRGSRAFDAYVHVCESGEPWIHEVTYDTPFGDGYMLGTFVQRTRRLGDGLINFLTDVTEQRRMEAELRSYADVVAHDLSEPIAGHRDAGRPARAARRGAAVAGGAAPAADEHRARPRPDRRRARLRAGGRAEHRAGRARPPVAEVAEDLRPRSRRGATLEIGELPEVDGDPRQLRRVLQNLIAQRAEVPRRGAARGSSSRRCATARSGS